MDRLIASNTVATGSGDTAPVTGTPGQATSGNPATNTPATVYPAYAFNAFQEELVAVIAAAGITLDRANNAQLLAAIKRIGQNTVVLADTGAVNAYTAVNATPLVAGTWVNGVVQQVKVTNTNTAASTYAPDGLAAIPIYGLGLQPLQGNEMFAGGTAILMKQTITGVNSGNPIAVLYECAGGAQQTAPATQPLHAVQFGQVAGIVGSVRNLVMSVTAASATATLTADEIIVETALGGLRYCLPSFSKTINLATTGAGGMDTGTAPVSGYVALYAIWNPTTQTAALLAQNAATLKGNVYSGANMPAGYTASALVGVWPTDGTGKFKIGYQVDRRLSFPQATLLTTTSAVGAYTSLSLSSIIPANAKTVAGYANVTNTTTPSNVSVNIAGDLSGSGLQFISSSYPTITGVYALDLLTPSTLFYQTSSSTGVPTYTILASSYTI